MFLNHTEDHQHEEETQVEPKRGQLLFAIALTGVILIAEVAGGFWSHSLALLSDAAHVLTDLVSLLLSFGALLIAARPVTKEHTFGWHRAEVLAALANGALLLGISGFLLWEAYLRLQNPPTVRVTGMLVVAAAGLLANGVIAFRLRGHAHDDLNIRSAYLHVLADLAGSFGVVLAAVIMLPTKWYIVDPILGMVIALAVLFGSFRLLNDTVHILLEGVPPEIELPEVYERIRAVPGVDDIHDLHIWTICSHLFALSVHITVGERTAEERDQIVQVVNEELSKHFGIAETTVQAESQPCRTEALIHLVPHRSGSHGHSHK